MNYRSVQVAATVFILLAASFAASAQLSPVPSNHPFLDPLFTDNMVLQRGQHDPVWGWATRGSKVAVVVAGKRASGVTDQNGRWTLALPPLPVGGPYTLTAASSDNHTVTLSNVLVGDVWVCSGQSNMQFGVGNLPDAQQEVFAANYPDIRLMVVPIAAKIAPQDTSATSWQVCTPQSIMQQANTWNGFSAVGYFFGRELHNDLKVPIGLIESNVGGTPAEAWTSETALRANMPKFKAQLDLLDAENASANGQQSQGQIEQAWYVKNDPGSKTDPGWADPNMDVSKWPTMPLPGEWTSTNLPGLQDFDGVVWYRKDIDLTNDQASKSASLHFYADDDDAAWVNGVKVGTTDGYTVNRGYAIPAGVLKTGRNVIAIRVMNTGGGGGIYGDPSSLELTDGGDHLPLAGNWSYKIGAAMDTDPAFPTPIEGNSSYPTVLYNGMIRPLIPYAIKGVIWYQGEANEGDASDYYKLLPTLIGDWRGQWREGDFPFLIAQLAGYQNSADPNDPSWPQIREAQWDATQTLRNVGIATAVDIGDQHNIHPTNKLEIARRLSLVARNQVYHESIEDSGPVYNGQQVSGKTITVDFTHADSLTTLNGAKVTGFEIAGADHKFYPADAKMQGQSVVVSSPKVPAPVAVRYAWKSYPACSLYNSANLPAFPFRTDTWPLSK